MKFKQKDIIKLKYKPKVITNLLLPLWKRKKSRNNLVLSTHKKFCTLSESKQGSFRQKTYIYNKNLFQYQTKDIVHLKDNNIIMSKNKDILFNNLQKIVYNKFLEDLHKINFLSKLTKKDTFGVLKDYSQYAKKTVRGWQNDRKYLIKRLFVLRSELKLFLIYLLTLKGAKTRKYHSRVRYLTEIPLFLKDFKAHLLYAYICENRHKIT